MLSLRIPLGQFILIRATEVFSDLKFLVKKMNITTYETASELLISGMVGVLPTDTLYGLVASIQVEEAVERVYELKKRKKNKPCIILISDPDLVRDFGVPPGSYDRKFLKNFWPGPVSIIFEISNLPNYLTRGSSNLAFRVPDEENLRNFLRKTGPIIAPSANVESMKPATTLSEACIYFGDEIDFYIDGGCRNSSASRVIRIEDGQIISIR